MESVEARQLMIESTIDTISQLQLRLESLQAQELMQEPEPVIQAQYLKSIVIEEVQRMFPEDPIVAVAVARCESGLRMVQSGKIASYGREESFGVMQIHAKAHHNTAIALGLPLYQTDLLQNLKMARHIYEHAGHSWIRWTCYTSGDYLKFL